MESVNQIDVNAVNQQTLASSVRKPLLFLDVEATGIDAEDRLVQVAFKAGDLMSSSYFKAPLPVKLVAMSVNNITNKMLEDKTPFEGSASKSMLETASKTHIMVAHNVPYDASMLKKEGIIFEDTICTLKIAHFIDEECKFEKHNLSYLRYYYDIDIDAHAHDAMDDVLILEKVFEKLANEVRVKFFLDSDHEVVQKMIEISKNPTLYRKFNFGKYKDCFVSDVAQDNVFDKKGRSWMQWLLSEKINNPSGQEDDWIYTLNYYLNAYEPARR